MQSKTCAVLRRTDGATHWTRSQVHRIIGKSTTRSVKGLIGDTSALVVFGNCSQARLVRAIGRRGYSFERRREAELEGKLDIWRPHVEPIMVGVLVGQRSMVVINAI